MNDSPTLTPEELVALLRAAGVEGVSVGDVQADIVAGCPVEPDGRLDLIAYLVWLLKDGPDAGP